MKSFKGGIRLFVAGIILASATLSLRAGGQAAPQTGTTGRVSVASDGTQADDWSWSTSISADGRYVAFTSYATNLVSGDSNYSEDVFVHDRVSGETSRVSVASDGTQGNSSSYSHIHSISADGRYVTFASASSNLVKGDTNEDWDIFVHDRESQETALISVASDGTQANYTSHDPYITDNGRYVTFSSLASNLVEGDTNESEDVFVHDRSTGETSRVSIASGGTQGNDESAHPSISVDGGFVAFYSAASNLVSGDTNEAWDIFVHNRTTGNTKRVSLSSDGTQANDYSYDPAISADGAFVTFSSSATNLVGGDTNDTEDIFVHERATGKTTRASLASDGAQGNDSSDQPLISGDGRFVTFLSWASNLVGGDTNNVLDIFVRDLENRETSRVSVASDGTQANDSSENPTISTDGRYVAFMSYAFNLVPGDTNLACDIFVHDREGTPPKLTTTLPIVVK
jgi:cold shock CspA family protein